MTAPSTQELLRRLPAVGVVLEALSPSDLAYAPAAEWTEEARLALAELRAKVLGDNASAFYRLSERARN